MLKLLIVLPLMLVGGALALAVAAPVLALLPLLFAIAAGVFVITLVFGILGVLLRVFTGLLFGAGGLLIGALGFGLLFAGAAFVLVVGFALAHLLVPLLVIALVIWLIRRSARSAHALPPPQATI